MSHLISAAMRRSVAGRIAVCLAVAGLGTPATLRAQGGWPLHGLDLGGSRFSPLTAVDTANVARLVRSGPTTAASRPPSRRHRSSWTPPCTSRCRSAAWPRSMRHGARAVAIHPRVAGREALLWTGQSRCRGGRTAWCTSAPWTAVSSRSTRATGAVRLGRHRGRVPRHHRGHQPAPAGRSARPGRPPPARPVSASAPRRWCTAARYSWGSPASDTVCIPTRVWRWWVSRGNTDARDSWPRSTRGPVRPLWQWDVTGPRMGRAASARRPPDGVPARPRRGRERAAAPRHTRCVAVRRRVHLRDAGGGCRARTC